MPKDILITPMPEANVPRTVVFGVRGATEDTGLALLQRLYVLLFSGQTEVYRNTGGPAYSLMDFLRGANYQSRAAINSVLGLCVTGALEQLDPEDAAKIASFECTAVTASEAGVEDDQGDTCHIRAVLELKDGTTLEDLL